MQNLLARESVAQMLLEPPAQFCKPLHPCPTAPSLATQMYGPATTRPLPLTVPNAGAHAGREASVVQLLVVVHVGAQAQSDVL